MSPFLYPLDTVEDVRTYRTEALAMRRSGQISQWSSNSTSVTKNVQSMEQLESFISECEKFLKQWDPEVAKANPDRSRTQPFMC